MSPKTLPDLLRRHVRILSEKIGERHDKKKENLDRARDYVAQQFSSLHLDTRSLPYSIENQTFHNIEATLPGRSQEILLVGAHYDSRPGTPGADDNASGVAAMMALAERLKERAQQGPFSKTLRFVAFVNEEHPFGLTKKMGSYVYAKRAAERGDTIHAALIFEMLGYYSEEEIQRYPAGLKLFYPKKADFIAVVSNLRSGKLAHRVADYLKKNFPTERLIAPSFFPGVNRSDQWSFWRFGIPALMITDTADYRTPHYHQTTDSWDTIDYEKMARLVFALEKMPAFD